MLTRRGGPSGIAVAILALLSPLVTVEAPFAGAVAGPAVSVAAIPTEVSGPTNLGTFGGTSSGTRDVNDSGAVLASSVTRVGTAHSSRAVVVWTDGTTSVIPTIGGQSAWGSQLTDSGAVYGSSTIDDARIESYHAFRWTRTGGLEDLGGLGGTGAFVTDANDSDEIVGYSYTDRGSQEHAFKWTRATGLVDLGTLGGLTSQARSINNDGLIVGTSTLADGTSRAVYWDQAGIHDLGSLGGWPTSASFVNDSGTIVGVAYSPTGPPGAIPIKLFIKPAGAPMIGVENRPDDLVTWPVDLNDANQIVGFRQSATTSIYTTFFWDAEHGMVDIGGLGGNDTYPKDLSETGVVVGASRTGNTDATGRAFSWTTSSGMTNLGTLSGKSSAESVNDDGIVVGESYLPPSSPDDDGQRAVRWQIPRVVSVRWSESERARIQQLEAFYGMDYDELTKFGVYVLAFINAVDPQPNPTPVVLGPPGTAVTQTITWDLSEVALLDAVKHRWVLDNEDAHRWGFLVLSFIAVLQGH